MSERSPLIQPHAEDDAALEPQDTKQGRSRTPEVLILCLARAVETGSFSMMAPIIPDMVARTGVRQEDIGFYAGAILSSHAVAESIACLVWTRLSDHRGRKPVLVSCLVGVAVTIAAFGLSQSIWQMIAVRSLMGLFSASELTVRVMLAEKTGNDPEAYAWLSVGSNIACTLLPALAGGLYGLGLPQAPAIVPCMVAAVFVLTVAVVVKAQVKETGTGENSHADGENNHADSKSEMMSARQILAVPAILPFASSWFLMNTIFFAHSAVIPVAAYTRVDLGGWSMSPRVLSFFMAYPALIAIFWVGLAYTPLVKRLGKTGMLVYSAAFTPIVYAWTAALNSMLQAGQISLFWGSIGTILAFRPLIFATIGITLQVTLNDLAPANGQSLLNSMMWSMTAAIRAVLPAAASSTFAYSVEHRIFGGQLVWIGMTVMGTALFVNLLAYANRFAHR